MVDPVQIVGFFAAAASVTSFLPQAWKIIRTNDVQGLSARMYTLTAFSFSLWLAYGVLSSQLALIIPNALCLTAATFILSMILLPQKKREVISRTLNPES